jgi:hypothetical protein
VGARAGDGAHDGVDRFPSSLAVRRALRADLRCGACEEEEEASGNSQLGFALLRELSVWMRGNDCH